MTISDNDTHAVCESADEQARGLLSLVGPEVAAIVERIDRDVDLQLAGVDSASLIELGLIIESELGVSLPADQLDRLNTIAGIGSIIDANTNHVRH